MSILNVKDLSWIFGESESTKPYRKNPKEQSVLVHSEDATLIRELVEPSVKGPWIAGGACLDWFQGLACQSDIDVYFASKKQFEKYTSAIDRHIIEYGLNIHNKIVTENAITLDLKGPNGDQFKLQLIKKNFYPDAQSVIDDFDITVCQIAWDGSNLVVGKDFITDLKNKKLRFYKISPQSHKRLVKYMSYGYEPDNQTFKELMLSSDIDWDKTGADHYA